MNLSEGRINNHLRIYEPPKTFKQIHNIPYYNATKLPSPDMLGRNINLLQC